mgnify:FL=1
MTRTSEGTFKLQYCTAFIAAAARLSEMAKKQSGGFGEDRTCGDYTFYKTSQIWKDVCDEYAGFFL